jgi:Uma2 family endonuclease
MNVQTTPAEQPLIVYPSSDGQPMAENTLQFQWIVTIQGGLDALFRRDPNVFVAGDLLWYPVERRPDIRAAPGAMVVFGRPKGYRDSYRQWVEGGIAPQVVFEVLSPGNTPPEMLRKLGFYDRHGVEEYYLYDPERVELLGWKREAGRLLEIPEMTGWVSPRLGVHFDLSGEELQIIGPDGRPFASYVELAAQRDQERQARERAERQAVEAQQKAERLAAQLRALGAEPES